MDVGRTEPGTHFRCGEVVPMSSDLVETPTWSLVALVFARFMFDLLYHTVSICIPKYHMSSDPSWDNRYIYIYTLHICIYTVYTYIYIHWLEPLTSLDGISQIPMASTVPRVVHQTAPRNKSRWDPRWFACQKTWSLGQWELFQGGGGSPVINGL